MTPEQKAVVLDAAQELQVNETWWEEFEYEFVFGWVKCTSYHNPLNNAESSYVFRRKPRTITVTIPRPHATEKNCYLNGTFGFAGHYDDEDMADKALAAIREAMGDE